MDDMQTDCDNEVPVNTESVPHTDTKEEIEEGTSKSRSEPQDSGEEWESDDQEESEDGDSDESDESDDDTEDGSGSETEDYEYGSGDETEDYEYEEESQEVSDGEGETCPICLDRLKNQDIGTPESCDHTFCLECIQEWSKNVNTCPVDRQVYHLIFARHPGEDKIFKRITVEDREQDDGEEEEDLTYCEACGRSDREDRLLLCDGCDLGYHCECLDPPLTQVPVEEWFCPDCEAINNQQQAGAVAEIINDDDEIYDIITENDVLPHTLRPRVQRRQVARTRMMERVVRQIHEIRQERSRRFRRMIIVSSESESESASNEVQVDEDAPSTSTSVPKKKSPVKKKRKVRKRTTKRKAKGKKTTKTKAGTKKPVNIKKRRKRRKYKRRKRKTTARKGGQGKVRKVVKRRELPVTTVKSRIAKSLGLSKPPVGRTIPLQKRDKKEELTRADCNVTPLSIMGSPNDLVYFHDEHDEDRPSTSSSLSKQKVAKPVTHLRFSEAAIKSRIPIGKIPTDSSLRFRPKQDETPAPKFSSGSSTCDVLGSIFQEQELLHMKSCRIRINRDGSLTAPSSGSRTDNTGTSKETSQSGDISTKQTGNDQDKSVTEDDALSNSGKFLRLPIFAGSSSVELDDKVDIPDDSQITEVVEEEKEANSGLGDSLWTIQKRREAAQQSSSDSSQVKCDDISSVENKCENISDRSNLKVEKSDDIDNIVIEDKPLKGSDPVSDEHHTDLKTDKTVNSANVTEESDNKKLTQDNEDVSFEYHDDSNDSVPSTSWSDAGDQAAISQGEKSSHGNTRIDSTFPVDKIKYLDREIDTSSRRSSEGFKPTLKSSNSEEGNIKKKKSWKEKSYRDKRQVMTDNIENMFDSSEYTQAIDAAIESDYGNIFSRQFSKSLQSEFYIAPKKRTEKKKKEQDPGLLITVEGDSENRSVSEKSESQVYTKQSETQLYTEQTERQTSRDVDVKDRLSKTKTSYRDEISEKRDSESEYRSAEKQRSRRYRSRSRSRERRRDRRDRSRERKDRSRGKRDRSRSRERKERSRSRDRKERSRSRDRKERSRSRDRKERSRSRDRRDRSRSRDKREKSKSRERKERSRSRERRERSRSREKRHSSRRERSRSRELKRSRSNDSSSKRSKREVDESQKRKEEKLDVFSSGIKRLHDGKEKENKYPKKTKLNISEPIVILSDDESDNKINKNLENNLSESNSNKIEPIITHRTSSSKRTKENVSPDEPPLPNEEFIPPPPMPPVVTAVKVLTNLKEIKSIDSHQEEVNKTIRDDDDVVAYDPAFPTDDMEESPTEDQPILVEEASEAPLPFTHIIHKDFPIQSISPLQHGPPPPMPGPPIPGQALLGEGGQGLLGEGGPFLIPASEPPPTLLHGGQQQLPLQIRMLPPGFPQQPGSLPPQRQVIVNHPMFINRPGSFPQLQQLPAGHPLQPRLVSTPAGMVSVPNQFPHRIPPLVSLQQQPSLMNGNLEPLPHSAPQSLLLSSDHIGEPQLHHPQESHLIPIRPETTVVPLSASEIIPITLTTSEPVTVNQPDIVPSVSQLEQISHLTKLLNTQAQLAMLGKEPVAPEEESKESEATENVFKVPLPPILTNTINKVKADKENMEMVDMDMSSPQDNGNIEIPTSTMESDKPSENKKKKDRHREKKSRSERHKHKSDKGHKHEKEITSSDTEPQKTFDQIMEDMNNADEIPSSAVELTNKEKYLRKLHLQERVVDEVKTALKPFYSAKKVNKEQYKEILRRAVPKVCHSKSGDINPVKIRALVDAYVAKFNKNSTNEDRVKT